jgi:uncharacterized protein YbbC (DUF1343 family)
MRFLGTLFGFGLMVVGVAWVGLAGGAGLPGSERGAWMPIPEWGAGVPGFEGPGVLDRPEGLERQESPDSVAVRPVVTTGAEVLIRDHLKELDGKRVGLVMNPTARVNGVHMLDTLAALEVNITALFAAEHGFRGDAGAGEYIENGIDRETGLPVYSLYGKTRKPTAAMLETVDLLLFDMQDVGARFYTYISTLGLLLESVAGTGIEVWVLDRPNPHGGERVSGWTLEPEFISFVGMFPIPVLHGLTMGEIAAMMIGEGWLSPAQGVEQNPLLRVIPMEGWERRMLWPDTGLPWVAPSPNLQTFEQAFLYPGTAFFEGVSLSEGRGTTQPFLLLGDPSLQLTRQHLANLQQIPGLFVEQTTFRPVTIPGVAFKPKHEGREVQGIRIEIKDYTIDPVRVGLAVLAQLWDATENPVQMEYLYLLSGSREIDGTLAGDQDPMTLDFGKEMFEEARKPYLLYD